MIFYSIILLVIIQRLTELYISKRNEKWLIKNGAVEYGRSHYKFLLIMHALFFISMIAEYNSGGGYFEFNTINNLFLVFFILLQVMRIWILRSLGKYWNTKLYRIPGSELIKKGPYKYFRHPNYIVVACEIFVLPMIFNLYYTAIIFSILNLMMMLVRIPEENKILNYK